MGLNFLFVNYTNHLSEYIFRAPTFHGPFQLLHESVTASYPRCSKDLGLPLWTAAVPRTQCGPLVQLSTWEWLCPWLDNLHLHLIQKKPRLYIITQNKEQISVNQ